MSKSNNKESTNNNTNEQNQQQGNQQQGNQQQGNQQQQSFNHALDQTRDNIRRTTDEARQDIPRYAQTISELQEQSIQAAREITDSFIEFQKQAVSSFQSATTPNYEKINRQNWATWTSPQRYSEMWARAASNYADNAVAFMRLANDTAFANIEAYRSVVNQTRENAQQISQIGRRNAQVYEEIARQCSSMANSATTG